MGNEIDRNDMGQACFAQLEKAFALIIVFIGKKENMVLD